MTNAVPRPDGLSFRNIDVSPDDPVEEWGVEGVLTALERGGAAHWGRLVLAVKADPWGPVAGCVDEAVNCAERIGGVPLLRHVLGQARQSA
ncbi:MAG: hypothetical protein LBD77_03915 [Bifidobacteriaceae bacterium]|jgi:hypothetical protein|nr:hypothetical protein [Bifidobacteriaceae bacterium]